LKSFPKQKTLILITIITSIPFIFLTIIFIINEYRLISLTNYGMLHYELVWTSDMVKIIFTSWGSDEMKTQITMLYIDYLYIPFYSLFGIECILLLLRKYEDEVAIQEFGLYIILAPLFAGIFDVLENINLLLMLKNNIFIFSSSPFLASLCAVIKITFLAICLCFVYILLNFLIMRRNRETYLYYYYFFLICIPIFIFFLLLLWNFFLSFLIGIIYSIILFLTTKRIKIFKRTKQTSVKKK
ncbi:MAG: hypothetical protein ACTSQJ_17180, partial [Promethearchaeota archaeon]